jgi:hypothetical protein
VEGWTVYVLVGGTLIATGLLMMRGHVQAWRTEKNDPTIEDEHRTFFYKRYCRRMQTSALIAVIGALIPFGILVLRPGLLADADVQARVFTVFWGGVLLLALWVILLGVGDFLATSAYSRAALARIRLKQRELEQQIAEIRRRQANGHKGE